ncbi:MAG: hypothetical protein H5T69_18065, partial [Chloroflexi bacterium]|nr:hypothetical protein [Chloroflexota bacterium]
TEFYDALGCSMRYIHYYTGSPDPVVRRFDDSVEFCEELDEARGQGLYVYDTPHGQLVQRLVLTVDRTWRTVGFPVKTPADLRALTWLYRHTTYHFDADYFRQGSELMGERGEPQFWVPKSPYQALAQRWMKLPDLIYALADAPDTVHEAMRAIDDSYDPLYQEIVDSGLVHIVNLGENIHDQLLSPRYWEQYLLPFYEKRCGQLRAAGIYSHNHIDGYFRSLLPYLAEAPFDGIEALTPAPQGDVELEEIAEAIGDKVLLDGIPAVLFMPQYSLEELMAFVERVVALFAPRLVLGISDELPEGTDESVLERVAMISAWCREHPNRGTRADRR